MFNPGIFPPNASQPTTGPASVETSLVYNGAIALTPAFAYINASANGDSVVIAGVVNKIIRVLNGLLIASADVNLYFRDGAGGTRVTGTLDVAAKGGFQIPYCPIGNFQTSQGNDLVINLSGAILVGGWLTYVVL